MSEVSEEILRFLEEHKNKPPTNSDILEFRRNNSLIVLRTTLLKISNGYKQLEDHNVMPMWKLSKHIIRLQTMQRSSYKNRYSLLSAIFDFSSFELLYSPTQNHLVEKSSKEDKLKKIAEKYRLKALRAQGSLRNLRDGFSAIRKTKNLPRDIQALKRHLCNPVYAKVARLKNTVSELQDRVSIEVARRCDHQKELTSVSRERDQLSCDRRADSSKEVSFMTEKGPFTTEMILCIIELKTEYQLTVFHRGLSLRRFFSGVARNLVNRHLAEVLCEATKNNTLLTDETTKQSDKLQVYNVITAKGDLFCLGLRAVVDKSSQVQLDTLKDILTENSGEDGNLFNAAVTSFKNLMSDSAATQHKFNSLFQA